MNLIKVSSTSRTSAVAGAIAGIVREHHRAEMQAIGAAAINQAVKALILATGYLREDGISVRFVPEFTEITIDEKVRTAVKMVIEPVLSLTNVEINLQTIPDALDQHKIAAPDNLIEN